MYGDVPLIKVDTIKNLISSSEEGFSILTSFPDDPYGYGRVIKNIDQNATGIVEQKDANDDQKILKRYLQAIYAFQEKY